MKTAVTLLVIYLLLFVSCNNEINNSKRENHMPESITKDSLTFKSGYSDVNGLKMYYEMHGNKGEFLVLIHGGGSTIGTSFARLLPLLAKEYQVIAVELQAHGHTSDRDAPETFEQDADDVATLLRNLRISKASFFGFSNGGNTSMQVAVRHPEIVNKLVIASAFYKREGMQPGFFDGMEKATLKDMPQDLQAAFLKINPDSSRLLAMFTKDRDRMLHFKDWPDEMLQSVKVPALIINGDQDVVTNEHAVAMSRLIQNSRLMILPAGHGSYMGEGETPDTGSKMLTLTIEIIKEFLDKR